MIGRKHRLSLAHSRGLRSIVTVASALICVLIVGLPQALSGNEREQTLKIFVSVLPQAYFVERVGGDRVDVSVMVGPGQSPHTYEPAARQMADISRADMYFRVGVPFEHGLIPKIRNMFPDLAIVDTRENVDMLFFTDTEHHEEHGHEHHGDEGGAPDPHIWLDPKRVKIQAHTIAQTLVRIDPDHEGLYRKNLEGFLEDLDRLDRDISRSLSPYRGTKLYVFHPAFGYFADSYGLIQVAFESEGKEPSARQLADLIEQARSDGVKVIFVQPQFSRRNAQAVARAIDGAVVPIDPLPRDYLTQMRDMAQAIQTALADRGDLGI
ncbi:MAG: metal ABC transporter solute-binding protein, Zn/Mn family [Desulfomonilia bacterium]